MSVMPARALVAGTRAALTELFRPASATSISTSTWTCAGCGEPRSSGAQSGALQGARSDADLVNHHITPEQLLAELVHGLQQARPHKLPIFRIDAQQYQ